MQYESRCGMDPGCWCACCAVRPEPSSPHAVVAEFVTLFGSAEVSALREVAGFAGMLHVSEPLLSRLRELAATGGEHTS